MLEVSKEGNVVAVKESILSFVDTKVSYWYYDLEKNMKSSHGKKDDVVDREMAHHDRENVLRLVDKHCPEQKTSRHRTNESALSL